MVNRESEKTSNEQWKTLNFTERRYDISNRGRICSFANSSKGKIIRGKAFSNRLSVDLRIDGVRKSFYVHRLVAEHFVERPSEKHRYVRHINGDTTDNRAENLEWVTEEDSKSSFYQIAKSGKARAKKRTEYPRDGHEYFLYAGFYFRVHDSGGGKFIRLTVEKNITKSVSLSEITLERKGEPRPSTNHVILYKDGDCYNISPDNLKWVTRSEKSKILLKNNRKAYARVQEMGKRNKKPLLVSDRQQEMIIKYREKGRSYSQISKILGIKYARLYRYCKEKNL